MVYLRGLTGLRYLGFKKRFCSCKIHLAWRHPQNEPQSSTQSPFLARIYLIEGGLERKSKINPSSGHYGTLNPFYSRMVAGQFFSWWSYHANSVFGYWNNQHLQSWNSTQHSSTCWNITTTISGPLQSLSCKSKKHNVFRMHGFLVLYPHEVWKNPPPPHTHTHTHWGPPSWLVDVDVRRPNPEKAVCLE